MRIWTQKSALIQPRTSLGKVERPVLPVRAPEQQDVLPGLGSAGCAAGVESKWKKAYHFEAKTKMDRKAKSKNRCKA